MYLTQWAINGGSQAKTFDWQLWLHLPVYGAINIIHMDALAWPAGFNYNFRTPDPSTEFRTKAD
jgi:hypothetical protein